MGSKRVLACAIRLTVTEHARLTLISLYHFSAVSVVVITSRPSGLYCADCVHGVKGSILRSFSMRLKMFRYGYLWGGAQRWARVHDDEDSTHLHALFVVNHTKALE